jgi:hypothetical protein
VAPRALACRSALHLSPALSGRCRFDVRGNPGAMAGFHAALIVVREKLADATAERDALRVRRGRERGADGNLGARPRQRGADARRCSAARVCDLECDSLLYAGKSCRVGCVQRDAASREALHFGLSMARSRRSHGSALRGAPRRS